MFEMHVFAHADRGLYAREWDEWLKQRHDCFVLGRNQRPDGKQRRESDRFDADPAVYILGLEDEKVVSSARLIPCCFPTIVSEYCAYLCEREPAPNRWDWIDWSRTLIAKHRCGSGAIEVLCTAVMEYCVQERAAYVGGLQENFHMAKWQWFGWRVRALGLPVPMENGADSLVAYVEVNQSSLDQARDLIGTHHALLNHRGQWPHLKRGHR